MKNTFLTVAAAAAFTAALGLATPALAQSSAITNAQLSQKAGQMDKALESINQAVASDKTKDKDKAKACAYTQDAKQDYAGARTTYNQLLALDAYKTKPVPVTVYNRLLQIARDQKNEAEAKQVLQKALVAYPNNKTFLLEDLNLSMQGGAG
nr:hypothetical protein [Tanacetum cinerariifolium]